LGYLLGVKILGASTVLAELLVLVDELIDGIPDPGHRETKIDGALRVCTITEINTNHEAGRRRRWKKSRTESPGPFATMGTPYIHKKIITSTGIIYSIKKAKKEANEIPRRELKKVE